MTWGEVGGLFGADGFGTTWGADGIVTTESWPDIQILVNFTTGPLETPTWTDIATLVHGFTIQRGRTSELAEFPASTATFELDNSYDGGSRPFDPDDTSSPYAGKLTTNRRVRVQASWDGFSYILWDGYIEDWPAPVPTTFDAESIQVTASDALSLFAGRRLTPAKPFTIGDPVLGKLDDPTVFIAGTAHFGEQRSGDRVGTILDLVGWPSDRRDIDEGLTRLIADSPDPKTSVVDSLNGIARTEYGRLLVTADGDIAYWQRRSWTTRTTQAATNLTLTDNPANPGSPYTDLAMRPAARVNIRNLVERGVRNGRTFVARDSTSCDSYGVREDSQTDLLMLDDQEAQDQAEYVLARYKDPVRQIERLTLEPFADPAGLWPQVLSREIGDRVTVERTPRPGATTVSDDYWIEAIGHTATARRAWSTTWHLARVDDGQFFTIGDPVLGKLDDPMIVLAY